MAILFGTPQISAEIWADDHQLKEYRPSDEEFDSLDHAREVLKYIESESGQTYEIHLKLTGKWRPNKEHKPHYGSFEVTIMINGRVVREENLRKVDFDKVFVYKGAPDRSQFGYNEKLFTFGNVQAGQYLIKLQFDK
jgi:hypothetical protein